jgi:hypothetical protein
MLRFCLSLVFVAAALLAPDAARADRFWALQLEGGSVILSLDPPQERGTVVVFHRSPDGTFFSLPSREVRRITIAEGPGRRKPRSLDGQILIFGRDSEDREWLDRDREREREAAERPATREPPEPAYGVPMWGWGSLPSRPMLRPAPPGRVRVGPNGFPVLSPPGSPGSMPRPIGLNGYPVLSPERAPGVHIRRER